MENTATLHPIHPTFQFISWPAIKSIRLSSGEAAALEGWLDDEDCE